MGKEFCGVVTHYGISFDVHWDAETKRVFVARNSGSEITDFSLESPISETKEKVMTTALETVKKAFGD